ncbi:MAG: ABC transporter ATP-binding protein [bacterium]|nr:ABC transporter ATP-binding protein [bacterium]
MKSDVAINVEGLSKKYVLKKVTQNREGQETRDFWALKDVFFEIKQGDSIGIIGPNGSGKSTLLKILSGITKPTTGNIEIRGKVASVLDIGAGFNIELSGKENIFLNGQIHGFSYKEIEKKYAEIIDFSGIASFIEEPVKTYSNGMYLRLAFSILAHLDFDIYLFDEVMGVGDTSFQIKVKQFLQRMNKMHHATFIFVSHNLIEIKSYCNHIYMLNQGSISKENSNDIIEEYINFSFDIDATDLPLNKCDFIAEKAVINDFFELQEVYVRNAESGNVLENESIDFFLALTLKRKCKLDISYGVENILGTELFYVSTLLNEIDVSKAEEAPTNLLIMSSVEAFTLKRGKYILTITIMINGNTMISQQKLLYFEIVSNGRYINNLLDKRPNVALIKGNWKVYKNLIGNEGE